MMRLRSSLGGSEPFVAKISMSHRRHITKVLWKDSNKADLFLLYSPQGGNLRQGCRHLTKQYRLQN